MWPNPMQAAAYIPFSKDLMRNGSRNVHMRTRGLWKISSGWWRQICMRSIGYANLRWIAGMKSPSISMMRWPESYMISRDSMPDGYRIHFIYMKENRRNAVREIRGVSFVFSVLPNYHEKSRYKRAKPRIKFHLFEIHHSPQTIAVHA